MDQKKLVDKCKCSFKYRGQSVTFIYVDSTEGWKNVQDSKLMK